MSRPNKSEKAQRLIIEGQQHYINGDLRKAEACLKAARKAAPDFSDAGMLLGLLYLDTGRANFAAQHFKSFLKTRPDDPDILNNYGVACLQNGDDDNGFKAIERAAYLVPDNVTFQIDYGIALIGRGRPADAVKVMNKIYPKASDNLEIAINLGHALRLIGDIDRSRTILETAYKTNSDNPSILNNLAVTLEEHGMFDEAATLLSKAVQLSPQTASLYANLGSTLRHLGRYDEAIVATRRAVELEPDEPEWSFKLAMILLLLGNFKEGWPHYQTRWRIFKRQGIGSLKGKKWNGAPLGNKTLLLRHEQGPGDQITFATCLNDAIKIKENGHIIFECDPRLVPCFSRTYPEIEIISHDADGRSPKHDVIAGLGDLPGFFRPTIDDFKPFKGRKIIADPALLQHWKDAFSALGKGPKIGIAWRGGAEKISILKRSFDLKTLMPVLQIPNCHFINIQYGASADEIKNLQRDHGIIVHNWPEVDPLHELENHIAQIDALDLIIQASNTSAHIAGALHKPVFLAQSFSPYWLWSIDSSTSLWHPHIQQFRASAAGEWNTVISDMADALTQWISKNYSHHD